MCTTRDFPPGTLLNAKRGLLLQSVHIEPARGGARLARLPFLANGPVDIDLRAPLTS